MSKIFGRLFSREKIHKTQMNMYVWWLWLAVWAGLLCGLCEVEGQCSRWLSTNRIALLCCVLCVVKWRRILQRFGRAVSCSAMDV